MSLPSFKNVHPPNDAAADLLRLKDFRSPEIHYRSASPNSALTRGEHRVRSAASSAKKKPATTSSPGDDAPRRREIAADPQTSEIQDTGLDLVEVGARPRPARVSGFELDGGSGVARARPWRRPARGAARSCGALSGCGGAVETRSAGRGRFWPKGRRRPSRVRISMAPCSEGKGAGRGWRSRGQHSIFSTRALTFNSRIPCGRAAIAAAFWCLLETFGRYASKRTALAAELRFLRSLAEVLDSARGARETPRRGSICCCSQLMPHSVPNCWRTIRP